ncbi:MAG: hypothetical protein IJ695_01725 [Butyrivibrio sp.]|nr:hypothetical protein [Butyrivibrio sp.]
MNRKFITAALCAMLLLSACGAAEKSDEGAMFESVETVQESADSAKDSAEQENVSQDNEAASQEQDAQNEPAAEPDKAAEEMPEAGTISEQQALDAVRNYYGAEDASEEGAYWDVSTIETGEIVVLYRSYTGSINRYYVDVNTGDTYVTEQVPGIIDDEQKNGETFNVKDYM